MTTAAPAIIHTLFPNSRLADDAFCRDGMSPIELRKLHELVIAERPARVLEIGMANGTSSVVIADALRQTGQGHLTSIDPNQTRPIPHGYDGAGVHKVRSIMPNHCLMEAMDFLALPQLVQDGATFDFILVDGYHSFDLTLLDLFYADHLLAPGGLLVCHDSSSPAVYKALRWLETNKPYERLSPPLYTERLPLVTKVCNRLFRRADRHARKTQWHMLVAYRKQSVHAMEEHALTEF